MLNSIAKLDNVTMIDVGQIQGLLESNTSALLALSEQYQHHVNATNSRYGVGMFACMASIGGAKWMVHEEDQKYWSWAD